MNKLVEYSLSIKISCTPIETRTHKGDDSANLQPIKTIEKSIPDCGYENWHQKWTLMWREGREEVPKSKKPIVQRI